MLCVIYTKSQNIEKLYRMKTNFLLTLFLILTLIGFATSSFATHIVGGELEMTSVGGNNYRLRLILYFDAVNGNPGALDQNVNVHTFAKSTNRFVQSFPLPLVSNTLVNYTNPSCAVGNLVTRRIVYERTFPFNPNLYADQSGYYAVWERCCRNGVIDNIINPGAAGQAFYMEFPPLLRGGQRFINSSPQLFPPLSDYACVNQPFFFNFSGTDPDGDQLVYALKAPTNGFSSTNSPLPPNPIAGPYPSVRFTSGINVNNMIPGNPPLSIDATGIIRLNASRTGLFVFAVSVKEFRNGVQIGEVVREFQLLVLDCRRASPPIGRIADATNPTRFLTDRDTIKFKVEDANRCANLRITDLDPNTVIKLRTLAVAGRLSGITLGGSGGNIPTSNDVLSVRICAPECPPTSGNQLYSTDIIIEDNSCAVPLLDTVRINVLIEKKKQDLPIVRTSLGTYDSLKNEYLIEIEQGEPLNFSVIARDLQNEQLKLAVQGLVSGMTFPNNLAGSSPLSGSFAWTPPCNLLMPNEDQREFVLNFNSTKTPKCELEIRGTTRVRIIVKKKKINIPAQLSTNLVYDATRKMYVDSVFIGEATTFAVRGVDPDKNDSLALSARGNGFNLTDVRASFPSIGRIPPPISQNFSWSPPCEVLQNTNVDSKEFIFDLNLKEYNRCKILLSDTIVKVAILVQKKVNLKPITTPEIRFDQTRLPQGVYVAEALVGDRFSFFVRGDDPEKDSIVMGFQLLNGNATVLGMNYPLRTGRPILRNRFTWQIPCNILIDSTKAQEYNLIFTTTDIDPCGKAKTDTARVVLTVKPRLLPNRPPKMSAVRQNTPLPFDEREKVYVDTVYVGNRIDFDLLTEDIDLDSVRIEGFPEGFRFADFRMIFRDTAGVAPLRAPFSWQTTCDMLNLAQGQFQREFLMTFKTRDFRLCQRTFRDSVRVKLVLLYNAQNNRKPEISADIPLLVNENRRFTQVRVGEAVVFNILGDDADRDSVVVSARGLNFNFSEIGIQFRSTSGRAPLRFRFGWQTLCEHLRGSTSASRDFNIRFYINDLRPCNLNKIDSMDVTVRVNPFPNNNPPTVRIVQEIGNANNLIDFRQVVNPDSIIANPNQTINLRIEGEDRDLEGGFQVINITGQGQNFNFADYEMQFQPASGISPQVARFTWAPTCEMLAKTNGQDLVVQFTVVDRPFCNAVGTTSRSVRFKLRDLGSEVKFNPPNVFTPNGDGKNDAFVIPNLPPDNCADEFERIDIYNRWGAVVFTSNMRDFAWTGGDLPAGVYFYTLFYKNRSYKGTVTMLRGS
jgi:gliding motility-associated-like protein